MRAKRKYIIVILICSAVAIFLLNSDLRFLIWSSGNIFIDPQRAYAREFNEYKDDFQIIGDVVKGLENEMRGGEFDYALLEHGADGVYLLNANNSERIALSDAQRDSLSRIIEAFGHGELQLIHFGENRISFVTSDDFAVVYSFDNKKPEYVRDKSQEKNYYYYTKKLRDNWYAITGTSKDGMPF
jgi:hypothetical protein